MQMMRSMGNDPGPRRQGQARRPADLGGRVHPRPRPTRGRPAGRGALIGVDRPPDDGRHALRHDRRHRRRHHDASARCGQTAARKPPRPIRRLGYKRRCPAQPIRTSGTVFENPGAGDVGADTSPVTSPGLSVAGGSGMSGPATNGPGHGHHGSACTAAAGYRRTRGGRSRQRRLPARPEHQPRPARGPRARGRGQHHRRTAPPRQPHHRRAARHHRPRQRRLPAQPERQPRTARGPRDRGRGQHHRRTAPPRRPHHRRAARHHRPRQRRLPARPERQPRTARGPRARGRGRRDRCRASPRGCADQMVLASTGAAPGRSRRRARHDAAAADGHHRTRRAAPNRGARRGGAVRAAGLAHLTGRSSSRTATQWRRATGGLNPRRTW